MEYTQIIWTAIVQGLTEFLPVSSSAHLILLPKFLGWKDQGLAFDIAVHVGTVLAVMIYFRKSLLGYVRGFLLSLTGQFSKEAKMALAIGFATIPVGLFGLFGKAYIENCMREELLIAITTIIFGGLLWVADQWSLQRDQLEQINWRQVLVIGFMQALALIPGTSRSGITMTAGLWVGLTRKAAAEFSFLLAIPVILLAGGLQAKELMTVGQLGIAWQDLLLGLGVSFIVALVCIHVFLKLINKIGYTPFVIYRLLLGALLLYAHGFIF